MSALEISGLRKTFGGVVALDGVDLSIDPEEILGIVGPNGSGKTTLFNVVTGALKPTAGSVHWRGEDISGLPAHKIARKGLVRTFQQAMSFPALSVRENILIAHEHGAGADRKGMSTSEILRFVGLEGRENEIAGSMPFGNLRRLGLALALAARPILLLLDEPAAGLNDSETEQLAEIILQLPGRGIGICLIDHDMNLIASICRRLVVLDFGTKIAEGPPGEVLNDKKVVEVYLGAPN
ncbi:MAG TPA: ABC transporter ATP-binding protein [Roseiarcus sp.]|jgi:branched-chain amino acid transport system ATP-binding protein